MKDSSDLLQRVSGAVADRSRVLFRWSERTRSPWPEILVVGVVALVLLSLVRESWFFGDDWALLSDRFAQWSDGDRFAVLFRPHNEHLLVLQVLVYLTLESTVGIGSALPYLVVVVAGHVALLWALRTVLVRLDVPLWARIIALVWFGWFGAGAENLVWPFQMGFVWSFAFAAWGLLVATKPGPVSLRRDLGASALLLAGLATSSTAISVVVVGVAVVAVVSRSIGRVLRIFAVPVGLYAAWYLFYGSSRMVDETPVSVTQIVPYFTRGVSNGLDRTVQFAVLGLVLGFAALVVVATTQWFDGRARATVAALASVVGVFYLLSAVGRGAFGVEQATAIRYVYFCGALVVPILVLVAVTLLRRFPRMVPVIGALVVVAVVGNATSLVAFRNDRRTMTNDIEWRMTIAALYADSTLADPESMPDPTYTPDITLTALASLRADGLWDPAVVVTPRMLVDGATRFGWRVFGPTKPSVDVPTSARILSTADVGIVTSGGCTRFTPAGRHPEVVFAPGSPGVLTFESDGTTAGLRFRSIADPDIVSDSVDLGIVLGRGPQWMALYPIGAEAIMDLSVDSPTTMCGIVGD